MTLGLTIRNEKDLLGVRKYEEKENRVLLRGEKCKRQNFTIGMCI